MNTNLEDARKAAITSGFANEMTGVHGLDEDTVLKAHDSISSAGDSYAAEQQGNVDGMISAISGAKN